jgi:hypothetical protein
MVFQNYALYPHYTVAENLGFSMRVRGFPKPRIAEQIAQTARVLGLDPLLERRPAALSGGQRQRVAMGRALVRQPSVMLMDEPLSNLDAKLRVAMRGELIRLHQRYRTTTLYVTHDQVEAMTLGDRIAGDEPGACPAGRGRRQHRPHGAGLPRVLPSDWRLRWPDLPAKLRQIGAETLLRKATAHPSSGTVLRSRLARAAVVSVLQRRPVNVTTTDLVGPPQPLYLAGARMLEVFPVLPLMANVTLGVGALSYAGRFAIAVTADRDTYPDLDVFVDDVRAELATLDQLVAA